ncbi:hypothetical protein J7M07_08095 [bacterium]|nr:hypothetical protein [bacterium]
MKKLLIIFHISIILTTTSCGVGFRSGPNYSRPKNIAAMPDSFRNANVDPEYTNISREWWKAFGDTKLDSLVNKAVQNNLNIEKATASVMEFQARNTQARAGWLQDLLSGYSL